MSAAHAPFRSPFCDGENAQRSPCRPGPLHRERPRKPGGECVSARARPGQQRETDIPADIAPADDDAIGSSDNRRRLAPGWLMVPKPP